MYTQSTLIWKWSKHDLEKSNITKTCRDIGPKHIVKIKIVQVSPPHFEYDLGWFQVSFKSRDN